MGRAREAPPAARSSRAGRRGTARGPRLDARRRVIATYLDSSALVRLCVGEGDLRPVEEAILGLPVTSVLAAVELPIAIHTRFHRGLIDGQERDALLDINEGI